MKITKSFNSQTWVFHACWRSKIEKIMTTIVQAHYKSSTVTLNFNLFKAAHKSLGESIENAFQLRQYLIPVRFLTALKLFKLAVQIKRLSISTFCEENTFHASSVLRWRGCWRSTWWPGRWVAPCRALHSNRPPSDVQKMCRSVGVGYGWGELVRGGMLIRWRSSTVQQGGSSCC